MSGQTLSFQHCDHRAFEASEGCDPGFDRHLISRTTSMHTMASPFKLTFLEGGGITSLFHKRLAELWQCLNKATKKPPHQHVLLQTVLHDDSQHDILSILHSYYSNPSGSRDRTKLAFYCIVNLKAFHLMCFKHFFLQTILVLQN